MIDNEEKMIRLTDNWQAVLPHAVVGILALRNLVNPSSHPLLDEAANDLADQLKKRYGEMDRPQLRKEPTLAAYDSFYRSFRKTYHVQLQLESVVFQGKPIKAPSAVVTAMFMAELETGLLTAVHDMDKVFFPLAADVARGGEAYIRMDGSEQKLKEGDMFIRDQQAILSSVIYGPDQRTKIDQNTTSAIFTTYGPPGINQRLIGAQLELIKKYTHLFSPEGQQIDLVVLPEEN